MSSSEYNQLLKFLYFEGYADSYEEAETLLEEMTDEEFEELIEAKDIPQEVALAIANRLKGAPQFSRRGKLAGKLRQYAVERNKKRLAKLQKEEFEAVVEYLFVEGYADTVESAELMAECISEDWANEIMEAKADSEDPVQRLRDRNERNVDPSIPTGYRTASRRTRHELSRGKKQQKGQKTNYDNLGNMNRSRYRQQQFKRTGNDLYK